MVLLDTHYWIWFVGNLARLQPKEKEHLEYLAERSELCISMISVWEIELLQRRGKIRLALKLEEWLKYATGEKSIRILPIDERVILTQRTLPESFHPDPADRLITSTSILSGFELATADQKIIDSKACKIWNIRE